MLYKPRTSETHSLAAGVANVDMKLQIYSTEWDQPSKARSFQ